MAFNNLSILLQKDGFSFIVTKEDKLLHAAEIKIKDMNKRSLTQVLESNLYLQQDYQKIAVCVLSKNFCLTPALYYDRDQDAEKWLGFNTEIFENDIVLKKELKSVHAYLIYALQEEVFDFFKTTYKINTIKHSADVFIQTVTENHEFLQDTIFIHAYSNQIEYVVFKNGKLTLYNIFDFETKEDFVYHVLNVAKQLNLALDTIHLYYFGRIENSTLKMLMNFVKHVIPGTEGIENLHHFTLLNNLTLSNDSNNIR